MRSLREAPIFGNGHPVRFTERVFTGIEQGVRKRFAPPWIRAAEIQIGISRLRPPYGACGCTSAPFLRSVMPTAR